MMKHFTSLLLFMGIIFTACKRDKLGNLNTASITIKVNYPATYSTTAAAGATVTLTSAGDGSVKTATTDNSGEALISGLLPGDYSIGVSKTLTATEAQTLTGISTGVTLNAVSNNVKINNGQSPSITLQLQGSAAGSLLIREVYYTGSKTPAGGTYFSDQFIEIYNNSTDTIYLDSLCIADAYGNAGLINPGNPTTPFGTDQQHTYVNTIWRIPGTGKQHKLDPGKSIIIAQDGVNHKDPSLNPASPVDLSAAEWETYNERPDNRDVDAPAVPNLDKLYYNGGFDWNLPVFGASIIIFRADFASLEDAPIPGSTQPARKKVPNSKVIDAFEALKDGGSIAFKRIPVALDAGFVFADVPYNMQSFRRRSATTINGRKVFQDTNNSTNDFEKIASPRPKAF